MILVFLLCSGCGVVYVLDLSVRRKQIQEMLELIRYLRREIRCSYAPLHQILSSEYCPVKLPLLREMNLSEPFDLTESYQSSKCICKGEMFFSEREWEASDHLFLSLGRGDGAEQEERLSLAETAFLSAEQSAGEALGKKGKAAVVLGCSAGAVLVLMLL